MRVARPKGSVFSVTECAEALGPGTKKDWLREQIRQGHIDAEKIGARFFVPRSQLAYLMGGVEKLAEWEAERRRRRGI